MGTARNATFVVARASQSSSHNTGACSAVSLYVCAKEKHNAHITQYTNQMCTNDCAVDVGDDDDDMLMIQCANRLDRRRRQPSCRRLETQKREQ